VADVDAQPDPPIQVFDFFPYIIGAAAFFFP
jgi:hypothetical protein